MSRGWMFVALLLACVPTRIARGDGNVHIVAAGETVSGIIAHHGLTLDQLLEYNEDLDPDRIRIGARLTLGDIREYHDYQVQPGDTLSGIAKRHEVTLRELGHWNPKLRPDHIRIGQTLRIRGQAVASVSESVGSPSDGSLKAARRLPRHPAYEIRERGRAWATDETVRGIVQAFDHVREQHPEAARLRVHDLSLKTGGRMRDHKSHQSGRDVDLAYFQSGCDGELCEFKRFAPQELDVERTWSLLVYWLERDMLEAVFIDYRLQGPLYRHARANGATRAQLARWFQYPSGTGNTLGVIRHFPKHADHMHVRFACHESDPECKTFRPLLTNRHAAR